MNIDDTATVAIDKSISEVVTEDIGSDIPEVKEVETLSDDEKAAESSKKPEDKEKPAETIPSEKPEKNSGFMKRINKLTGRNKHYESEIETLKTKVDTLEKEGLKKDNIINIEERPKKADFENYEDYLDAKENWNDKRDAAQSEAQEKRILAIVEKRETVDKVEHAEVFAQEQLEEKLDKGRKNHKDFDAIALKPDTLAIYSEVVHNAVVESEISDELVYFLGQNLDILKEISDLKSPIAAIKKIAVIEHSIQNKPKDKIISDASEPIHIVTGGKEKFTKKKTLHEAPYEEYVERRTEGEDVS